MFHWATFTMLYVAYSYLQLHCIVLSVVIGSNTNLNVSRITKNRIRIIDVDIDTMEQQNFAFLTKCIYKYI